MMKGMTIEATEMTAVRFHSATISSKSNSRPIKFIKKMRPRFAMTLKLGRAEGGKMFSVKPGTRPMTVGPSKIPEMTSAMTEGC